MAEAGRGARQAPSWIGTLVIAIAVAVLCLRAAAELRRAVAPPPAAAVPEGGAPAR
jgi:hypothetical protein